MLFPLDVGVAADHREDAAELGFGAGELPSGVEGADASGGCSGDGVAVGVFAQVVVRAYFGEDFVAEEADEAVAYGVVERAAHSVVEGAMEALGVGGDLAVGGCARSVLDGAGVDEDADHDGDSVLGDEVVDGAEEGAVATVGVAGSILKDHEGGGGLGGVLRRDVDPVVRLHAVVDLAGVGELFAEMSGGRAGLEIGEGTEGGQVEAASEAAASDFVVEGVELAEPGDMGGGVPEVGFGAGDVLRGDGLVVVDDECGLSGILGGEEEV